MRNHINQVKCNKMKCQQIIEAKLKQETASVFIAKRTYTALRSYLLCASTVGPKVATPCQGIFVMPKRFSKEDDVEANQAER
jgi:hypothetical protein